MALSSDQLDRLRHVLEAVEDGRAIILEGDVPSDDRDITEDVLDLLDDLLG